MNTRPHSPPNASPEGADARHDLSARARTVGVVVWCSFLAACVATMLLFAFVDPDALASGNVPAWWTGRHTVYALGFFFFWLIAACSAALTIYMAHTERSAADGDK